MPPEIATVLCVAVILALFASEGSGTTRTSKALWIPVVWVSVAGGSRLVAQWFGLELETKPEQCLDGNPMERAIFTGLMAAGLLVLVVRRQRVGEVLRANGPIRVFFLHCGCGLR